MPSHAEAYTRSGSQGLAVRYIGDARTAVRTLAAEVGDDHARARYELVVLDRIVAELAPLVGVGPSP